MEKRYVLIECAIEQDSAHHAAPTLEDITMYVAHELTKDAGPPWRIGRDVTVWERRDYITAVLSLSGGEAP